MLGRKTCFDVDTSKYTYLEPIWPILANHPYGISLKELVKRSKLDQNQMLKTIETLSKEYNTVSRRFFTRNNIKNMMQNMIEGGKTDEKLKTELASSWICDKVMLYDRCYELKWSENVLDQEVFNEIKEEWLEVWRRG